MVFHIHIGNITGDLFFLFKLYKCNSKNWNRINIYLDIGSNWVVIIYLTVWNKKDEDKDGDKDEDKDGDKDEDKDGDKNGDKNEDKDGDKNEDKDGDKNEDKDGDKNEDKDGDKDEDKDGDKNEDKDGDKNEDKDGDTNEDKDGDKQKVHCTNTGTQEQFNKNCNNCTYLYLYPLFQ